MLLLVLGIVLGALLYRIYLYTQKNALQDVSAKLIQDAQAKAEKIIKEAHDLVIAEEQKVAADATLRESKLRLIDREKARLVQRLDEVERKEKKLTEALKQYTICKDELIQKAEIECSQLILAKFQEAEETAAQNGRRLIVNAIERLPRYVATCSILLEDESIKGKIIGKEGKNLRAFQEVTGVDLIIDDSATVQLSSFDPERRELAKMALQELIRDGRITPERIQDAYRLVQGRLDELYMRHGQKAVLQCKVTGLHPELIKLVGKMAFRHTQQQPLLEHSIEVAELMWMVAEELGLNSTLARKIGLLHDIGKVVSLEVAPTHALAGYKLALQYGESEEVANGIGCHHNEMEPLTLEAKLCAPCDALSSARPGARLQPMEIAQVVSKIVM